MESNMSDEKHNNKTYPEYNLDDLNGIPDEIQLDKTLAWENLYSRLHTNNRRKIKSWYRIAAASVLFALFLFGVTGLHKKKGLENNKQVMLRKKGGHKLSPRISEKEAPLLAGSGKQNSSRSFSQSKQSADITGNHQTKIQPVTKKNKNIQSIPQGHPSPELRNAVLANPNNNQALEPPEIQPKPDNVLDKLSTANAKPVVLKKRLRVVHLNELDEPAEATDNLVKNSGRHIFHLKWNEPFASSNNISGTTYSHNEMVKISLSSPN